MQQLSFCLITPSYAPDFERCKLLAWSVEAFAPQGVKHYIIVPKRDFSLFRQIQYRNTEVITVESILPSWIQRLPLLKNWWFSKKHIVVRGWIIQQIIKLAAAEFLQEDVFVFVDSDVAFIRPFDWSQFVRDNQVRLFRIPENIAPQAPAGEKWNYNARCLLNLPPGSLPVPGYIGQIMTWHRDHLKSLYRHIETVSGRGWIETVCSNWNLSEYVLYGVFVEEVLQASGHYYDSERICHEYWFAKPMSDEELQNFFNSILPQDIAIMISAKAEIAVQRYENLVKNFHKNNSLNTCESVI
ncbi:MAG: hypothetical protein IGS39_02610 [Calothrix sp. C42_A2020_038]|nr:hypothetical protein [Calothrix sp. C42_A2020_038]